MCPQAQMAERYVYTAKFQVRDFVSRTRKSERTRKTIYNSTMADQWKIELYTTASGDKPVEALIEALQTKARLKVYDAIELLQEFGLEVGYPRVKKLAESKLWEYRILGSDNIRIFYVAITGKTFLILHVFVKKKQKTPNKEIRTAEERLHEYRTRKNQR